MSKGGVRPAEIVCVTVLTLTSGVALLAQTALTQLGLTEAAAQTFLFEELKGPTIQGRRSEIAIAGTRAFLKLPPAARGPAATGLFAWAKAHVNTPAFRKTYATLRQAATPEERQDSETVDEAVKKELDDLLTGIAQVKQAAASMPPADRARILESLKEQEAQFRNPEFAKRLAMTLEAERAASRAGDARVVRNTDDRYPANPEQLFARRLRQFLEQTADANFSARTISLTGGADGIEFVDPVDRERTWLWQLAVIAGRDATLAARAAAETWLKEIER
jgi:hypothetical protein